MPYASRDEVLLALRQLISDRLDTKLDELTENTVIERLNADSLDQAELIMSIEEVFSISLEEEESTNNLATVSVGQLADFIWKRFG